MVYFSVCCFVEMEGDALILSLQTNRNDFAVPMKSPILSFHMCFNPLPSHLSNLLSEVVTAGNCCLEMTSDGKRS